MSANAKDISAQAVFDKAFTQGREPRSDAYKLGVLNCLRTRVDGEPAKKCPFPLGTAEADAYQSGVNEGRALSPMDAPPSGFDDVKP